MKKTHQTLGFSIDEETLELLPNFHLEEIPNLHPKQGKNVVSNHGGKKEKLKQFFAFYPKA